MPQYSELCFMLSKYLGLNKARLVCLARLLLSVLWMGTVNLTKISLSFGGEAKPASRYRRVKRFFAQAEIDFKKIALMVAGICKLPDEPWVIIFDRTRWDLGRRANNMLVLSVGVGDIAIPLFWKNIDKRGNSHAHDRFELLENFINIFGLKKIKLVLGDREFASSEFMKYLQNKGILFGIRVKDNSCAKNAKGKLVRLGKCCRRIRTGECWQSKKSYILWGNEVFIVALRIDKDLVVIATTLPVEEALEWYARRWEIETLFGALKSWGFNLEDTHMTKVERTEKWFAILAVAFALAYSTGRELEKKKATPLKKHGYKAMSCFRRGLDAIKLTFFDSAHPLKKCGNYLQNWFPWRKKTRQHAMINQKFFHFCPVA